MLTLRSSPTSPFGRKIKVAALITGHADKLTIVTSDTMNPDDPLRKDNPLGKIPVLVLADGTSVYDSRVIAEYLDHDAGGGVLIPKDWAARFSVLKLQALADGITDAAILQLYESRFRAPEKHEPGWLAHQGGKVERGLKALEANPPKTSAKPDIGVISVACLMDWMELRFSTLSSGAYPNLVRFMADFAQAVPDFVKSKPVV